jgi:hypothetical protein
MASTCCGDASKSEHTEVVITSAVKTTEVVTEQQAAKSECCNDKSPAKNEKHSCGC